MCLRLTNRIQSVELSLTHWEQMDAAACFKLNIIILSMVFILKNLIATENF